MYSLSGPTPRRRQAQIFLRGLNGTLGGEAEPVKLQPVTLDLNGKEFEFRSRGELTNYGNPRGSPSKTSMCSLKFA